MIWEKVTFKGDKKKAFQKNSNLGQSNVSNTVKKSESQPEVGFSIKEKSNETIEVSDNDVIGQDVMLSQLSNCKIIIKVYIDHVI